MGPVDSNGGVSGVFCCEINKSQGEVSGSTERLVSGDVDSPSIAGGFVPRCAVPMGATKGDASDNFSISNVFPRTDFLGSACCSMSNCGVGMSKKSDHIDSSSTKFSSDISALRTVPVGTDFVSRALVDEVDEDVGDKKEYFVRNDALRRNIRIKKGGGRGGIRLFSGMSDGSSS
ncbi:hypothetical protein [Candidatus Ichthyocystis sparus]|uniref:hypothetical protein n=1 Tax=Candidatus Ichthyocystis sparus TaxID=1561004 RepID=UPI000B89B956|nr:hypothetical protein [Candidatus Ichthyocystis sparus]